MSLMDRLLKIAGKDNFKIDNRIGRRYILSLCWRYGMMMIRGKAFALIHSSINSSVFIGKGVKVLEKRYLTVGLKTKIHDHVYIDALSKEGVIIGDNVVIGRNTRIECTGGLESVGKGIKIGNRTTFGSDCYFGAAGGIEIGDDVVAGQCCRYKTVS